VAVARRGCGRAVGSRGGIGCIGVGAPSGAGSALPTNGWARCCCQRSSFCPDDAAAGSQSSGEQPKKIQLHLHMATVGMSAIRSTRARSSPGSRSPQHQQGHQSCASVSMLKNSSITWR